MQHINDDMDELFKKAGENYYLKESASGWEDVASSLYNLTKTEAIVTKTKNKYTKFLLLLLPLLLTVIGTKKIFFNYAVVSDKSSIISKINVARLTVDVENQDKNIPAKQATNTKQKVAVNNNLSKLVTQDERINKIKYNLIKKKESLINNNNTNNKLNNDGSTDLAIKTPQINNENNLLESSWNLFYPAPISNSIKDTVSKTILVITEEKDTIDTIFKTEKQKLTEKSNQKNSLKNKFYIGIGAGSQLSQVKYQGCDKAGFDIGLIAGFAVNKKLSIETSLFLSKKYYYSDGKYFSMEKVAAGMPANMKIISLYGSTKAFEIPLKIKYNFLQKEKSNLFIATGISSYILTNEQNNYLASVSGSEQNVQGRYKKTTNYFTAAINFSAGYEHKIVKKITVRVEPYWQIPLKGIGIGSMPISSAGVHVGILLPLH